jgi:hypothetical protein
MQTTYNINQEHAVIGQLVDAFDVRWDWVLSSVAYLEPIPFGRGIVMTEDSNYIDGYKHRLPVAADVKDGGEIKDDKIYVNVSMRDLQKVTGQYETHDTVACGVFGRMWVETEEDVVTEDCFDGEVWCRYNGVIEQRTITIDDDLIADNVITATVNGVVCEETYAVSHDATMTAWAAKVAACPGIASATLDGGDNYVLTIVADTMGAHISITDYAVTGGVSQPNIAIATTVLGIPLTDRGKFRKSDDLVNPGTCARVEDMMWLAPHPAPMAPVMFIGIGGNGDD